jgi:two-component system nitrogen regulation sensor histidine kinase NtrY
MQNDLAPERAKPSSNLFGWPTAGRLRAAFGAGYGLAAAITILGIWLVATAPGVGPIGPASEILLFILSANLLLILGLTAALAWRILRMARERGTDAGVRLHLRFATLFAAAAVIPAVVVALFFGVLVNQGIEGWFTKTARAAVNNSADIAKDYIRDVDQQTESDLRFMLGELAQDRVRSLFAKRVSFSNALTELAEVRNYAGLYIVDGSGVVLARGEAADAPPYLAPPPPREAFAGKPPGETLADVTRDPDVVRVVYPMTGSGYGDAYLYVVRALRPGIIGRLDYAKQTIAAYKDRDVNRAKVQGAFFLAFVETVLLLMVGSAWLGMAAAAAVATPIARLVQAADRIAGGDLSVRVDPGKDPQEIAVLSNAFNRMTGDLQTQQQDLRAAGLEAETRHRFIERVLSGVSAGVIGLDEQGQVSALNSQAQRLLALKDEARGRPLRESAPELADVILAQAEDARREHDVDVTRGAETRRLRVRVSGGEEGGLVLTFDDITRLVAAQRNAAWRDVARRIAHEIKNPLTPIQLSAERLQRKYRGQVKTDLETFDRCTDTIIRQVGDIGRMVDEFSAFARMPAPKFAEEDAAELLRAAVFAQKVAHPDIELDLIEPLDLTPFTADGRMVAQALTNVLKNAGEAVTARLALDPSRPPRMAARLALEADELAFVVEDDGIGLPVKDRDRLTEPYVTTREKGTGLGLAIVKRICEDHGGELVLGDATAFAGARVELRFPRIRRAPVAEKLAAGAVG